MNRNNPEERSIIDYIIINQALGNKVVESETDNNDIYIIEGKNKTDHNAITATINIKADIQETIIIKWKQGNNDDWNKYNEEILEQMEQRWEKPKLPNTNRYYKNLYGKKHIGKRIIHKP